MTLVEVLVAMVILLVGVWTVVRGFPSLMRSVTVEQQRTQAARLAEGRLSALSRSSDNLPVAVHASPTAIDPADLWPDTKPEDPDNPTNAANNPNSRDDVTRVYGERLRVPAPPPGNSFALAVVNQGLVTTDPALIAAWRLIPLQQLPFAPAEAATPEGWFHLAGDGVLTIPPGCDGVIVDYVWEDTSGERHWVQGERILATDPFVVNAGVSSQLYLHPRAKFNADNSYPWGSTVQSAVHVEALQSLAVVDANGTHPLPGEVSIEPSFGIGLVFNAADAGAKILVDYELQTLSGKRLLYLTEEQVVPGSACTPDPGDPDNFSFATVQLGWSGLAPVFTDSDGNPINVIAVDLESQTQNLYYEGAGIVAVDKDAARTARIQLRLPTSAIGHQFRFYYGTVDQAAVEVYKPPATYFDKVTADSYADPTEVRYRTYTAAEAAPGSDYTALTFSMSNLGASVSVDYVWDDSGVKRSVVGELHTLGLNTAGNAATCSLNRPKVVEVRVVRGVSLKVRPWWRTPTGRLVYYDLDTILLPTGAL